MDNNTIINKIQYFLKIDNRELIDILKADGYKADALMLENKQYGREILYHFLEGLIIQRRGPNDRIKPELKDLSLSNNMILKKLRIAFDMKEDDMIAAFKKSGENISKLEINSMFRKKGNKHYRSCDDQLLLQFLKGICKEK